MKRHVQQGVSMRFLPSLNGISQFGAVTNWMGAVIVPLLLFWYGQRIENKIEASRQIQEDQHKRDEEIARSTALLANVAPLLFSNDIAPVTFALQILAPGDAPIPLQIHPLLLEVVTVYKTKNPELSDWALSILTSKLTPSEILTAQQSIPQSFVVLLGASSAPEAAWVATASLATGAARPPERQPALPQETDVAEVTQGILDGRYNVIVKSAHTEEEAVKRATEVDARLRSSAPALHACWKHPVAPSRFYGIVVGNGVSLGDAQRLRADAQRAGFPETYLRRIQNEPTTCTSIS